MLARRPYHSPDLPWTPLGDEEHRFRRLVLVLLLITFALSALMPLLPVPERPEESEREVPPRLAKLILERRAPPPPPPPPPQVEEPAPEPEPLPEQEVERAPEPEPEVAPEPEPVPTARERAQTKGVLAFADDLADLRSNDALERLSQDVTVGNTDSVAPVRTERALVTSDLGRASGGINTGGLSRDTGGTQLAGRTASRVESPVEANTSPAAAAQRAARERSGARAAEDIQLVFDRNKSRIDALYRRALRSDPGLQGKVVLRLTIAPSGEVTGCEIISSELESPDLERRIVSRVKRLDFGAADVETMTVTYPIEFFPA